MSETDVNDITARMNDMFEIMLQSFEKGTAAEIKSLSGITGGEGFKLFRYISSNQMDSVCLRAAAGAMGIANINASMGKIVAAPTGGSCGVASTPTGKRLAEHLEMKL